MNAERFQAVVAVHLFLRRGHEVLLAQRQNTGYEDGNFSVIAGHLDGGERANQAMIREAAEEAGIEIAPADLHFVHAMHRRESAAAEERIDLFFTATRWQGEPTICEPEKCGELTWMSLAALPGNVVPYVRAALERTARGETYSEFWPESVPHR